MDSNGSYKDLARSYYVMGQFLLYANIISQSTHGYVLQSFCQSLAKSLALPAQPGDTIAVNITVEITIS